MCDNFICFFETSDGILQDNLDAHFSYKCEIAKEISTCAPLFWTDSCSKQIYSKYSFEIPRKMMTVVQSSTMAG